jgi:hypothetical protein
MAARWKIPFSVNKVDPTTGRLQAAAGATVAVTDRLGTPVNVYVEDDTATGSTPVVPATPNEVIVDGGGRIPGFLDRGQLLKYTVSGPSVDTYSQEFEVPLTSPLIPGDIPDVSATYQSRTERGVANGYATLDGSGRVPAGQLTVDAMEFKGLWNAATNTPALADGGGNVGDFYRVSAASARDLGSGRQNFQVGDDVIYDGTEWHRASGGSSLIGMKVFNIADFGAALDDATDDTTAVQEAVDAAVAAGGGIVFNPGKAVLTAAITVPEGANVNFKGAGAEVSQFRWTGMGANQYGIDFNPDTGAEGTKDWEWRSVSDLKFRGSGTANGIGIRWVSDLRVEGCWIENFKHGMEQWGDHQSIHRSVITSCHYGVYVKAAQPTMGDQMFFNTLIIQNTLASIGIATGQVMTNPQFVDTHFGFEPYGIYGEGDAADVSFMLDGAWFYQCNFESFGNAMISSQGRSFGVGARGMQNCVLRETEMNHNSLFANGDAQNAVIDVGNFSHNVVDTIPYFNPGAPFPVQAIIKCSFGDQNALLNIDGWMSVVIASDYPLVQCSERFNANRVTWGGNEGVVVEVSTACARGDVLGLTGFRQTDAGRSATVQARPWQAGDSVIGIAAHQRPTVGLQTVAQIRGVANVKSSGAIAATARVTAHDPGGVESDGQGPRIGRATGAAGGGVVSVRFDAFGHAHKSSHAVGGSDPLSPSDIGALSATDASVTNARVPTAHKTSHEPGGSDALTALTDASFVVANKDGATGTYSLRTLGTGSQQAAPGDALASVLSAERMIHDDYGFITAGAVSTATYVLYQEYGNQPITAGTTGQATFNIDPASFVSGGIAGKTLKYKLWVNLDVNGTAPGVNITATLQRGSGTYSGGNASTFLTGLGSVVSGSGVTFTTPAAGSENSANSGDFTPPAAGPLLFVVTTSGTVAALSMVKIRIRLVYHWV